jgi:stage V sporulation protein G
MDDGRSSETALITVTVLDVQAVRKGQIIALAAVEIELDGVAFIVNGLQVIRTKEPASGREATGVALPRYRAPDGEWKPAIELPDELREPITTAILEQCCDRGITSRLQRVAA